MPDRPAGRVVTIDARVGLGDVRPDGRLRLDALADLVQDVADEDAATAPIPGDDSIWILRRLALRIDRTPRFRDALELATWCSGTGARWAERRTEVERAGALVAIATGLWVHTNRATGRPAPLPPGFDAVWGETARGRTVRARLGHPSPPADAARERWPLRATDVDVVAHVNNAAYWAAAEELIARRAIEHVTAAEIEFRAGVLPAELVELASADRDDGFMVWFLVAGEVRASLSVHSSA
jgi:acyl-ACP thioesterase